MRSGLSIAVPFQECLRILPLKEPHLLISLHAFCISAFLLLSVELFRGYTTIKTHNWIEAKH